MAYQNSSHHQAPNNADSIFYPTQKQQSVESKSSTNNQHTILRKLSLMKRGSSDHVPNADGFSFQRTLSILKPNLQGSILKDNTNTSFIMPAKSPSRFGFQQSSFGGQQAKNTSQTAANQKDTPLRRLAHKQSIISMVGEPVSASAFRRQPSIVNPLRLPPTPTCNDAKSPDAALKAFQSRINGIQSQRDSRVFFGTQVAAQTPTRVNNSNKRLPKIESSLSIKKMLHSLISLSSVQIDQGGAQLKVRPSNISPGEDPILD